MAINATCKWYGLGKKALANKEVDWDSDTIKVSLHTSSYTPDQDTHDYFDDITNEVSGTGYTAGGAVLANCALTYTAGTNVLKYDADDVTWSNATITARIAVIRVDTGVDSTSPVLGYLTFDSDASSSGDDFKITWNADGILKDTVS